MGVPARRRFHHHRLAQLELRAATLTGTAPDPQPKPPDERLAVVLAESVRAIERQASAVDELRGRATAMVGVGAVVAGFFGQPTLERGGWAATTGATAFAVLGMMAAFVLWPRKWDFVTNVSNAIAFHLDREDDASLDQFRWALADDLWNAYEKNEPKRKWLSHAAAFSCGLLVLEVGAFLCSVKRGSL